MNYPRIVEEQYLAYDLDGQPYRGTVTVTYTRTGGFVTATSDASGVSVKVGEKFTCPRHRVGSVYNLFAPYGGYGWRAGITWTDDRGDVRQEITGVDVIEAQVRDGYYRRSAT